MQSCKGSNSGGLMDKHIFQIFDNREEALKFIERRGYIFNKENFRKMSDVVEIEVFNRNMSKQSVLYRSKNEEK
jgi:hypothetical protein